MTIIKTGKKPIATEKLFTMIFGDSSQKLSKAPRKQPLEVGDWALYEKPDANGELVRVLAVELGHTLYATNSVTFIDMFSSLDDFFEGAIPNIKILAGTSRAGREFLKLEL